MNDKKKNKNRHFMYKIKLFKKLYLTNYLQKMMSVQTQNILVHGK